MTTGHDSGRRTAAPRTASRPGAGDARITGLAYLGLGVAGALGFLLIRSQLYAPGDAATTAANLVEREGLARLGVAADLTVVVCQALASVWFFKLFRAVDSFAAGALAAFGLVNAVVVLVATAFSATALEVAGGTWAATSGDPAATALLLYDLNGTMWSVGGLFFGLWLVPMGWLARRSGTMPRALGPLLMIGGLGYVLSAFIAYLTPDAGAASGALVVPATVGEFWMIGYLLLKGAAAVPADRLAV